MVESVNLLLLARLDGTVDDGKIRSKDYEQGLNYRKYGKRVHT
jgi:hypothetical protein